jgi:hypothetical protein
MNFGAGGMGGGLGMGGGMGRMGGQPQGNEQEQAMVKAVRFPLHQIPASLLKRWDYIMQK